MTRSAIKTFVKVALFAAAGAATFTSCTRKGPEDPKRFRLGWQPPWANQGQIVEVFKHTDVLSRNGVSLQYKAFTYGGPMTEAALAGEVDILFVGDQPAITLISRDPKWRIIARMVNYRSAIIVPPGSRLITLKDLAGKKVATALGSTTHRDTVRHLQEGGLNVGKDVSLVNVDQAEHAAVIARGGTDTWAGMIAAIATYDPTIAVAIQGNRARVLTEWVSPAVVVAHQDLVGGRSDHLQGFLQAYTESFAIYARDRNRFDMLYSEDSRLPLSPDVYRSMAAYEPNLMATDVSSIDISLDGSQQELLQRNADAALSMGIIKQRVEIQKHLDLGLAREAMRVVKKTPSH
mgnify:CR=1 FL=1